MAALDGAFALAEVDDAAVRVTEDLDLDVPRALEVLLEIDRRVAERTLRFAAGGLVLVLQLAGVPADAHAATAAAGRGLEDDRVADRAGDVGRFFDAADRAL